MSGKILVTPRSLTAAPNAHLDRLAAAGYELVMPSKGRMPGEADLIASIPGCVGWIAGIEPVPETVIAAGADLRVISRNGVGIDNLPVSLLKARGIQVLNTPGANARSVAELAVGLMLASLRHIPQTDAGIRTGSWPRINGAELGSQRVAIIGMGAIGQHVARIVSAFGAGIVAYDPLEPELSPHITDFRYTALDDALRSGTIVTLHCPPRELPLIDVATLKLMRNDSILINTARAALVDESALLTALRSGELGGYATDVFAQEPPIGNKLTEQDNVITTSHIGGLTAESIDRAAKAAVDNLLLALKTVNSATSP